MKSKSPAAEAAPAGASQPERRAAPRFSANPHTSCRVCATENQPFRPALIHNISTRGIRLVLDQPYDVGTSLIVELSGTNNGLRRLLFVRVVRVTDQDDGHFAVGCAFTAPLEGHELLALVL